MAVMIQIHSLRWLVQKRLNHSSIKHVYSEPELSLWWKQVPDFLKRFLGSGTEEDHLIRSYGWGLKKVFHSYVTCLVIVSQPAMDRNVNTDPWCKNWYKPNHKKWLTDIQVRMRGGVSANWLNCSYSLSFQPQVLNIHCAKEKILIRS